MFELMSVGLARPLVITGHDGAPNVVGGEREFHLLGVTADRARLRRVAPRTPSWRALRPFLVDAVLAPLGLDDEPGVYPGDWVAGPTGGEQLSRQGWRVSFTRQSGGATPALDDARLAVQVTGICAETWRDAAAGGGRAPPRILPCGARVGPRVGRQGAADRGPSGAGVSCHRVSAGMVSGRSATPRLPAPVPPDSGDCAAVPWYRGPRGAIRRGAEPCADGDPLADSLLKGPPDMMLVPVISAGRRPRRSRGRPPRAASYGRRSAMNRWPSPVPGSAPRPSSSPSSYVPASATSPPGPTASLVAAASLVLSL